MELILEPLHLDYTRVLDRDSIDEDRYLSKFKKWNHVVQNRLLAEKDKDAIRLLNDKTVYAYAFLKLDNNPVKLRNYQDLCINDPYRFKIMESANQLGKSLALDIDACIGFLKDHGKGWNGAIVSKSLPQSMHQMRRIKNILKASSIDYKSEAGTSDSMSVITLDIFGKTESTH